MLRSDDSVRRVRAMWLGSGALRWPVDWTYVEWGLAFVCAVVVMPLVGLAAGLVLGALGGIVWGLGLGGWITYRIFDALRVAVDADRPVRWWWQVIRHELRGGAGAAPGPQSMSVTATWLEPVGDERRAELATAVASAERWSVLAPAVTWWRRRVARRELARGVRARLEDQ